MVLAAVRHMPVSLFRSFKKVGSTCQAWSSKGTGSPSSSNSNLQGSRFGREPRNGFVLVDVRHRRVSVASCRRPQVPFKDLVHFCRAPPSIQAVISIS